MASCMVRFITKLPEAVPDMGVSVPANITVDGLSDLVNQLLGQDDPVDYEFLIEGEFLRCSLDKYVTTAGLSFESALTLEYTHRRPAPEPESALPHPDWISCVAASGALIYTGCYDTSVRRWKSGGIQSQFAGHTGPVKCIAVASAVIVTGSKDNSIRLWAADEPDAVAVGAEHTDSVECVAMCPASSSSGLFASGSWDRTIRLWTHNGPGEPCAKKSRKAKSVEKKAEARLTETTCLRDIHSQVVSGLCWPDPATIYSVSWDRSLRRIDATEGRVVDTWKLADAASSVAFSSAANLVGVGHADRALRMYDPRQPTTVAKTFRGHQGWVSDLAWAPQSSTLLVSSSYDCTLKVWDVRSATSLHTLQADTGGIAAKTLAVDWGSNGVIACGGTDGQLRLHRSKP